MRGVEVNYVIEWCDSAVFSNLAPEAVSRGDRSDLRERASCWIILLEL